MNYFKNRLKVAFLKIQKSMHVYIEHSEYFRCIIQFCNKKLVMQIKKNKQFSDTVFRQKQK